MMAAPLRKVSLLCLRNTGCPFRTALVSARLISSDKWDDDSPPPWAPRQVPLGNTFKGIYLTKSQNKKYWHGLYAKVNKKWKTDLMEMKHLIEERAKQPKPEPSMLHLVTRVKPLYGRPYWERDAIRDLKLDGPMHTPVIIPNKDTKNHLLKKVKHLVEIIPVRFPYGLPDTEEDYEHCVLRDNGEFVVIKKLEPVQAETAVVTTEDPTSVWDMKQSTIDRTNELKKMQYQLTAEYYPTKYVWKRNEDGKEYRYKGNFNVGSDKTWY